MKVGVCFSKELRGRMPFAHIVTKRPVYLRLLDLIAAQGWQPYVLTRLTYKGGGIFDGAWEYKNGKFYLRKNELKMDLVYDRSGGVDFPRGGDGLLVVNRGDFKILCWDKWATYKMIGHYMPKTFLLTKEKDIEKILPKIKTDFVVLKPFNGLKGFGVFIGPKENAKKFRFAKGYTKYIAQEFVDTKNGIKGITPGLHDLRVVVVNGEVVWCHVRVPLEGTYLANAAQGGNITEVDYKKVPEEIKKVVSEISEIFNREYDKPVFSLDFGIDTDGTPKIFETNDQIGFPKWEMKNRDKFLFALIENFKNKLYASNK